MNFPRTLSDLGHIPLPGECFCGCGSPTKLAPRTVTAYGWTKGQPLRYIKGHSARKPGPDFVVDPATGCWNWARSITKGYGTVTNANEFAYAHRVVYEQRVGAIPEGMDLDHLCRNKQCVNPEHLEPVSHAENTRRGSKARITQQIADAIRESELGPSAAADLYGVSKATIQDVRSGRTWS